MSKLSFGLGPEDEELDEEWEDWYDDNWPSDYDEEGDGE